LILFYWWGGSVGCQWLLEPLIIWTPRFIQILTMEW